MFTFQGKKNVPIKTVKIIDREKHTQIAVSCALVRVMQDKWKHTPPDFNGFLSAHICVIRGFRFRVPKRNINPNNLAGSRAPKPARLRLDAFF